jgi:hypothetical protein
MCVAEQTTLNIRIGERTKSNGQLYCLADNKRRFHRACEQIVLLDYKLVELRLRYNRAMEDHLKAFLYSLRLRMAVPVVKNAQHLYVKEKVQETVHSWKIMDRGPKSRGPLFSEMDSFDDFP